jgi:hypothetical protein
MKKLKSDNSITGLVPSIFSLLIFALTSALFGIEAGLDTLGVILLIYSVMFGLWAYVKTTNPYFLVSFSYLLVLGLFMIILEPGMLKRYGGRLDSQTGFLVVLVYFFLLWLLFLLINKRIKWRGREVMELAAIDVMEGEDSYTDRPRPVGKITGSRSEITGFAKYLRRKLIFMTSEENDRVLMVPVKMGQEFKILYKSNIDTVDNTRVTIDFEGNVSVHISKRDYLDYRDDLSFHHLCESLGNLVIEFYNQYIKSEEIRIIDKINSIKVGYFS